MKCAIDYGKPDMTVRYRRMTIRERVLRKLLGGKIQTAIIVPGDNVKLSFEDKGHEDKDVPGGE